MTSASRSQKLEICCKKWDLSFEDSGTMSCQSQAEDTDRIMRDPRLQNRIRLEKPQGVITICDFCVWVSETLEVWYKEQDLRFEDGWTVSFQSQGENTEGRMRDPGH